MPSRKESFLMLPFRGINFPRHYNSMPAEINASTMFQARVNTGTRGYTRRRLLSIRCRSRRG